MRLRSRTRPRRRGVILLVVLSLLTLFAAVGISFVYFSESEASQAANQKQGETLKLPDPDMLFNHVLRQIVYPTDNRSALFTHSLAENLYGKTGVNPNDSEGRLPRFYRDNRGGVRDPHLMPPYNLGTNPAYIGQDELFRLNKQFQAYDEQTHGALNPTYTYPDHKNPFLGVVAGDWTDKNGNHHGPVALARSFAREIKFRIAIVDTTVTDPAQANVVGYQEVVLNPYTDADYAYWLRGNNPLLPPGTNAFVKQITLPLVTNPYQYVQTPGAPVLVNPINPAYPPPVIQCNADGSNAFIVMDAATCLAHTMRPNPRGNPFFPPPAGPGGDVKNLPPEVKTLVGFDNAGNPIFDDHDSYWMDVGFPAVPWSNNKKIKPMAAIFIMSNDGKVNLNTAGNVRGRVNTNNAQTFHLSSHGLHHSEINPTKLGIPLAEHQQLLAGRALPGAFEAIRGRDGLNIPEMDPSTFALNYPTTTTPTYTPLLRRPPFYSGYNADGSFDGANATDYYKASQPVLLPGQFKNAAPIDSPYTNYARFPFYNAPADGFGSGISAEWARNNCPRSPLFSSPYVFADQLTPNNPGTNPNIVSDTGGSTQRTFGAYNAEALYRGSDAGADHLNSDLRRLIPTAFSTPQQRWQLGVVSSDLNSVGVAPWWYNDERRPGLFQNSDLYYNQYPPVAPFPPIPPARDVTPGRVSAPSQTLPWTSPNEFTGTPTTPSAPSPGTPGANGEFRAAAAPGAPPYWRSIFGNTDRLDLARQLPDYPMPTNAAGGVDPTAQLDFTNPVVRAQYFVALRARQRMAMEIYRVLVAITHPADNASITRIGHNAKRYLAQLSVNIVDYIDNDDYPTWMYIPDVTPTIPATPGDIVWGTELPRLLLNEIYAEATTGAADASGNTATYKMRTWVELYNPLRDTTLPEAWPDGANARLNINGTPVYRLILTTTPNVNTPGALSDLRTDPGNTLGTPIDMTLAKARVVNFPPANGTNPVDGIVAPSGNNYGTGLQNIAPNPANPGFFVVGPTTPPEGVTSGNFPGNDYGTDEMEPDGLLASATGPMPDDPAHRPAVLLQRLANPFLPHNPVPDSNPLHVIPGDPPSDPTRPYNPYITIDYAEHVFANHAVTKDKGGNPDRVEPQSRYALGKIQPYAGYGINDPATNQVVSTWTRQYPDANSATPTTREEFPDQPQHTLHRHNGINAAGTQPAPPATFPNADPNMTGAAGVTSGLAVNTVRVPFDWLVHLDRAPSSPGELLQVSGYRPFELTQQFNQFATVQNVTVAPLTFATKTAATVTAPAGARFIGNLNGVAWALKEGDMVYLTYTTATGPVSEWVLVQTIPNKNGPLAYNSFTAQVGQSGQAVTISGPVTLRAVVPFAHRAPWFLTGANVDFQSTNRLYRLLEFVAVRNPGVDLGQVRFLSADRGNIGAVDTNAASPAYGTRWIQISGGANLTSPAQMPLIRPNDALLGLTPGDALNPADFPPGTLNVNPRLSPAANVGDTLVINAGVTDPAVGLEQRVTVLELDWESNRVRVAMPNPPSGVGNNAGTAPLTLDYAYHSGRQPGRMNLNDIWDEASFVALADPQAINYYLYNFSGDPDSVAKGVFKRLVQQRQPLFYSTTAAFSSRLPGQTNRIILDPSNADPTKRLIYLPEDRPFQGMAAGDIPGVIPNLTAPYTGQNAGVSERPLQGIGNTWLGDRYQEGNLYTPAGSARNDMTNPIPGEQNDEFRFLRTLFEVGPSAEQGIGLDNPYRRYELLSKIWNNATVRSNTFSVWITIGYFEYDEVNGLGQELNQATGKNVRHRFFAVVDRTSIDSWLKSQKNFATAAMEDTASVPRPPIDGIEDVNPVNLPGLDPREETYTDLTVYSPAGAYAPIVGNVVRIDLPQQLPNPFMTQTTSPATPYLHHYGRLVRVESDVGAEVAMLLDPRDYSSIPPALVPPAFRRVIPPPYPGVVPPLEVPATYPDSHRLFVRLTLAHSGTLVIRPLPIPPAALYWTQYK